MSDTLRTVIAVADIVLLAAVLLVGYNGLFRLAASLLRLSGYAESLHNSPHERAPDADSMMPISLILPDCDADRHIVAAVKNLLDLDYPEYEVIAVCSGEGPALRRLVAAFGMVEVRQPIRRRLSMRDVRRVYRSPSHQSLTVLDKQRGGRHDALNAGVNVSRYPLFAALAAGMDMRKDALAGITMPFAKSHRVAAVGALPRAEGRGGAHGGLLRGLQQAEYLAGYPAGLAVPGGGRLHIIPGAFGAFRKQTVVDCGGFERGCGELGLVAQLHKKLTDRGIPHETELLPEAVFRHAAPASPAALFRRCRTWQKDLVRTLWRGRAMLNPRYGRAGAEMLHCWAFGVLAPVLELLACIAIPVSFAFGLVPLALLIAFLGAEFLFGILVSLAAVMSQQVLESDEPSLGRLLRLLLCAVLSNLGYRQVLLLFRVAGMATPSAKDG